MPPKKREQSNYNAPLFNSMENSFIILSSWYGEHRALHFLSTLMSKNLGIVYKNAGAKDLSGPEGFKKYVIGTDSSMGIKSTFSVLGPEKFSYKLYTDIFPNLKGLVDPQKLDETFVKYKVHFFFGPEWSYSATKHIWKGDECTSYIIRKKRV